MKIPTVKISIVEEKENLIKIKIEGQRTTLTNLLAKYLIERDDVKFASWDIDHPEYNYSYLIVNANNPKEKIKQTIDELLSACENLEKSLESELKKKASTAIRK